MNEIWIFDMIIYLKMNKILFFKWMNYEHFLNLNEIWRRKLLKNIYDSLKIDNKCEENDNVNRTKKNGILMIIRDLNIVINKIK